jgi:putative membrane-bound dehydrogenase-like protein
MRKGNFIIFLLLTIPLISCKKGDKESDRILSTFELDSEFQIELFVKEPLISDPVAMEIDEYGRMYVVEMHGYPLDKGGSGLVKLLTDSNGDGNLDKSTVFAEGLMLPTGIMRWKNGVIVTDAPNVLYLEDTDGDGKADIKEIILTGFAVSNPQHNVNSPLLGLDNWIYLGHEQAITAQVYKDEFGDRGGEVYFPAKPDGDRLPENARGRSVRFRPDQFKLENLSSDTQFGHSFDAWGRHFMVYNSDHIYHEVVPARYLERNPFLLISDATEEVSDHGNAAEVFPITINPEHQLLTDQGVFTSACGITAYTGGLFPSVFNKMTFVAEPVSNLIHADVIKDNGATFTASRYYEDKEFLASTDPWFRPVNMYIGPDGALYVIDYYRQYIEHPEWMAEEVINSGKIYNGIDKGRIYRITPKGTKAQTWSGELKLGDADDKVLGEYLSHQNIWWRRNAQRLLIDRNNIETVPHLKELAVSSNEYGRLHSLWTLEGMNALTPDLIIAALEDPVPEIRENAIKLADKWVGSSPELIEALLKLQDDEDPKVRFQLLCTLGYVDDKDVASVREKLLFNNLDDKWMQVAALSAPFSKENNLLLTTIERYNHDQPAYKVLVYQLASIMGASGNIDQLIPLLQRPVDEMGDEWKAPLLEGMAESLKKNKIFIPQIKPGLNEIVKLVFKHPSSSIKDAVLKLLKVTGLPEGKFAESYFPVAIEISKNKSENPKLRAEAVEFLSLKNSEAYIEHFKRLIAPDEPNIVQLTSIKALSSIPGNSISYYLLENWNHFTPDLRDQALNTFFVSEERVKVLLDALEEKKVDHYSIGWKRSVRLMNHGNKELRARARDLLASREGEREKVVQEYKVSLDLKGNTSNGKAVFMQHCANCHQIAGKDGVAFGPDLGMIRNRRPENILSDILNPNLSIADGHDMWSVELKSGESIQGLITSETTSALKIRPFGGEDLIVGRNDIRELKPMGTSAMPEGLENQINKQEMADLITFLKNFNN